MLEVYVLESDTAEWRCSQGELEVSCCCLGEEAGLGGHGGVGA